eukprot:jgi/Mesen1/2342/ME000155S01427
MCLSALCAAPAAEAGGGGDGSNSAQVQPEEPGDKTMQIIAKGEDLAVPMQALPPGTAMVSLKNGELAIRFQTSVPGTTGENYYCSVAAPAPDDSSSAATWRILRHTLPSCLPLTSAKRHLQAGLQGFVEHVRSLLNAFVDRRHQVQQVQEKYKGVVRELYHTQPVDVVELVIATAGCKVGVSLVYDNLAAARATRAICVAWPVIQEVAERAGVRRGSRSVGYKARAQPHRLRSAEDALKSHPLLLALPRILRDVNTVFGAGATPSPAIAGAAAPLESPPALQMSAPPSILLSEVAAVGGPPPLKEAEEEAEAGHKESSKRVLSELVPEVSLVEPANSKAEAEVFTHPILVE